MATIRRANPWARKLCRDQREVPGARTLGFQIHQLIAEDNKVVSDVGVSDGTIAGRVITFSTIQDGKIVHQIEFWPDPFEPATWRAEWIERI